MVKKTVVLYTVSITVGFYTTFVLVELWNWFVSPVFHVAEMSFWLMFGLNLIVGLLRGSNEFEEQTKFKTISTILDSCVPDEKRAELMEQLDELGQQVWWDAGWKVFGQVFANTITLGLGFVVHILAA